MAAADGNSVQTHCLDLISFTVTPLPYLETRNVILYNKNYVYQLIAATITCPELLASSQIVTKCTESKHNNSTLNNKHDSPILLIKGIGKTRNEEIGNEK